MTLLTPEVDDIHIAGGHSKGVGRLQAKSKLRYTWKVRTRSCDFLTEFAIQATYSKRTQKIRIIVNGLLVYDDKLSNTKEDREIPIDLTSQWDLKPRRGIIEYVADGERLQLRKDNPLDVTPTPVSIPEPIDVVIDNDNNLQNPNLPKSITHIAALSRPNNVMKDLQLNLPERGSLADPGAPLSFRSQRSELSVIGPNVQYMDTITEKGVFSSTPSTYGVSLIASPRPPPTWDRSRENSVVSVMTTAAPPISYGSENDLFGNNLRRNTHTGAGGPLNVNTKRRSGPTTSLEYQCWDDVMITDTSMARVEVNKKAEPIGRRVANTKWLHTWDFEYTLATEMNPQKTVVELTFSRQSKKVRIKLSINDGEKKLIYNGILCVNWEGVHFKLYDGTRISEEDATNTYSVQIQYDMELSNFKAVYHNNSNVVLRRSSLSSEDSDDDLTPKECGKQKDSITNNKIRHHGRCTTMARFSCSLAKDVLVWRPWSSYPCHGSDED